METELSLEEGIEVTVLQQCDSSSNPEWWLVQRFDGHQGVLLLTLGNESFLCCSPPSCGPSFLLQECAMIGVEVMSKKWKAVTMRGSGGRHDKKWGGKLLIVCSSHICFAAGFVPSAYLEVTVTKDCAGKNMQHHAEVLRTLLLVLLPAPMMQAALLTRVSGTSSETCIILYDFDASSDTELGVRVCHSNPWD